MKAKEYRGECFLIADDKVIKQFVYANRPDRKKKLQQWQRDINRLKQKRLYHIIIKPVINEQDLNENRY